jgi:hypothetical protein
MSHWSDTLLKKRNCSPARGTLEVTTERFSDAASLRARLVEIAGDGWLCLASEVHEGPPAQAPEGLPLAGEWALDDGTSAQLRQENDGWRIDVFDWQENPAGAQRAFVVERARIGGGVLTHQVIWSPAAGGVLAPWAARLTGRSEN